MVALGLLIIIPRTLPPPFSPFPYFVRQYLKDCGECDAGAKKIEGQSFDDGKKVFDARVYAKDETQLLRSEGTHCAHPIRTAPPPPPRDCGAWACRVRSEMSEAMELLASKVGALQEENAFLKEKLGGNVVLDFGDI